MKFSPCNTTCPASLPRTTHWLANVTSPISLSSSTPAGDKGSRIRAKLTGVEGKRACSDSLIKLTTASSKVVGRCVMATARAIGDNTLAAKLAANHRITRRSFPDSNGSFERNSRCEIFQHWHFQSRCDFLTQFSARSGERRAGRAINLIHDSIHRARLDGCCRVNSMQFITR